MPCGRGVAYCSTSGASAMTALKEQFRIAISEGGDTGMLVAADAFDESEIPLDQAMGELLRTYVEIQTYVRTSSPVPTNLTTKLLEFNCQFDGSLLEPKQGCIWNNKLGYYYLTLATDLKTLNSNINLLSQQPVKNLDIRDCEVNDEFFRILRNYRMATVEQLTLIFNSSNRMDNINLAELEGGCLHRLTIIIGLRRISTIGFLLNPKIRKGCNLIHNGRIIATHR